MKRFEDVLRNFNDALQHLTMRKDPITAKARYNDAIDALDEIARDQVAQAGEIVRKFRPQFRKLMSVDVCLQTRIEQTLEFWTKALQGG